ncbi:unnamed protein product [Cuscuta europaea]|uniref:Transcription repressor n=1 Tax=Cuscuta europaea TaxID=41803 RepID=A0A9P0ZTE9_CUSEU|nr:unnamed protein product [Cuscuta europaea]
MKGKKDRASSSHQSLITHVFPVSWLSKFNQKKPDFPSPAPLKAKGRFYTRKDIDDDDPFWSLSFTKEKSQKDPTLPKLKIRAPSEEVEESNKSVHLIPTEYNQRRRRRLKRRNESFRVGAAYSPRSECKIKALEHMKRGKMKIRKKSVGQKGKCERTAFDRFAVVKSSFDPEQDFKDSMMEMITQIGIKRPEELEELLACYLTLNCDHYHAIIIKAFRQVWFDLNQDNVCW